MTPQVTEQTTGQLCAVILEHIKVLSDFFMQDSTLSY